MAVTLRPYDLRRSPVLLAMIPLPIPLITPPLTTTYFIWCFLCGEVFSTLEGAEVAGCDGAGDCDCDLEFDIF